MNRIDDYAARSGRIISHCQQLVIGDLASLSKRDNDVAERARAQSGELNYE